MKIVGIDLSTDPAKCGICVLENNVVSHSELAKSSRDYPRSLLEHCNDTDVVAIDAPFGWPKLFSETLANYEIGYAFKPNRKLYRLRETDVWITEELPHRLLRDARPPNPFSVSTDKLGATAMACTILLNTLADQFRLSPRSRSTYSEVIEVYPAASLWAWGLPHRSYERSVTFEYLHRAFALEIATDTRSRLLGNDHCFDALIAALTGKVYASGDTFDPADSVSEDTLRTEGWIRVPNYSL